MKSVNNKMIDQILPHIKPSDFKAPLTQPEDSYFPDFLKDSLDKYLNFYQINLVQHVDQQVPFDSKKINIVVSKISDITQAISRTVELFYEGKILESTNSFFNSLDDILFDEIQSISSLPSNTNLYRARSNANKYYSKADLFHIKYEQRSVVSTNRYSVPGFPALYLGDSTFVCWEEFNRPKLRDLWFARISNISEVKIIQIQRIEDFLSDIKTINKVLQLTFLLRYLITFPLTIACSIKVKHPNGSFKPEYIIPQMLLQYISKKNEIDGIKFMSTKVDYDKLFDVEAYNYVFPVKEIKKKGFCSKLTKIFHSTEPTSLEMEEILYNPITFPMTFGGGIPTDKRQIELVEGMKTYYSTTSFGKIEISLKQRVLDEV